MENMMKIGTVNTSGQTQIGDHNTQHIEMTFQSLVQQIEASTFSDEEKIEAKSLLAKFLNHPITSSILGGVAGSLISSLK